MIGKQTLSGVLCLLLLGGAGGVKRQGSFVSDILHRRGRVQFRRRTCLASCKGYGYVHSSVLARGVVLRHPMYELLGAGSRI